MIHYKAFSFHINIGNIISSKFLHSVSQFPMYRWWFSVQYVSNTSLSLQKCCHEEIKIKFRLVRRLDGTIPLDTLDTLEKRCDIRAY